MVYVELPRSTVLDVVFVLIPLLVALLIRLVVLMLVLLLVPIPQLLLRQQLVIRVRMPFVVLVVRLITKKNY